MLTNSPRIEHIDTVRMPADEIAKILGIGKDSETFTKIMQIIADKATDDHALRKARKLPFHRRLSMNSIVRM